MCQVINFKFTEHDSIEHLSKPIEQSQVPDYQYGVTRASLYPQHGVLQLPQPARAYYKLQYCES